MMFDRYDLAWIATLLGAFAIQFHFQTRSISRIWRLGGRLESSVDIDRIYRREVRRLWILAAIAISLQVATVWIALENRP